MPYSVSTNDELKYVHVVYTGDVDIEQRQQARQEVFNTCNLKNYRRCLVDLRKSELKISESDLIKFANTFKGKNIPENYRHAGVINSSSHPDSTVEILISLNGINVKYFYNSEDAIKWLTAI